MRSRRVQAHSCLPLSLHTPCCKLPTSSLFKDLVFPDVCFKFVFRNLGFGCPVCGRMPASCKHRLHERSSCKHGKVDCRGAAART